jgi:hypothetical protein
LWANNPHQFSQTSAVIRHVFENVVADHKIITSVRTIDGFQI